MRWPLARFWWPSIIWPSTLLSDREQNSYSTLLSRPSLPPFTTSDRRNSDSTTKHVLMTRVEIFADYFFLASFYPDT